MKYQNDWHLKKNADVLTSLGTALNKTTKTLLQTPNGG